MRFGAIEAGGTKFVLAVGSSPRSMDSLHVIPTRTPEVTLAEALDWFRSAGPIDAMGIGSFGPAVVDPEAAGWGSIGNTPKPGWSGCDIAGFFSRELDVPVGFDTDVNAAALAESRLGAGAGRGTLAYVTVGTGIGGGLVIGGEPVHGVAHPEMGHIFPRRARGDEEFPGICPSHGDCLEGLASGPAIMRRWGRSLSDLPREHAAHGIIADYLAQLCHSIFAMTAAELVVLGGGVLGTPGLLDRVRSRADELNADYLPGTAAHSIVAPGLRQGSGLAGAMILAEKAGRDLS